METQQFLEYLHRNVATRNLAEEITYALVLRRRAERATATIPATATARTHRKAS